MRHDDKRILLRGGEAAMVIIMEPRRYSTSQKNDSDVKDRNCLEAFVCLSYCCRKIKSSNVRMSYVVILLCDVLFH
jgi:hypothetical protein